MAAGEFERPHVDRPHVDGPNADQVVYWNGPGGQAWADRQATQDLVLAPVSAALFARAGIAAGAVVIDIGCGCGATSIELARRAGPGGRVLGIDVSAPMLARARALAPPAAPVEFLQADATLHPFAAAQADLLFSRFGVMFFADPVASFANLRRALRPDGRLLFACWREPAANPWLMVPLQAAYRHVPRLPEVGPEDPGPFAFAREARVRGILAAAGFGSIGMEPVDLDFDMGCGRGLDAAVESAAGIGPASRAMQGQPEAARAAALQAIRAALAPQVADQRVALGGAIWIVTADVSHHAEPQLEADPNFRLTL
jgi:SAM-dependent methyltransferase